MDSPPTDSAVFDLLVVGGGVNGAGIARDAAGRGLSVLLVEQDDLAGQTSSASTKLIHGGLRYLEYGEFRLVREALVERERLLAMAPHIIWPLRFVLPQSQSPRPAWMVRTGLFLYDHLGGRQRLPGTETVDLDTDLQGDGLKPHARGEAFVYSDCWVEDSRLVVLNAVDAAAHGAVIRTRTRLTDARSHEGEWIATIEDAQGPREVRARVLVNAAGPWVDTVLQRVNRARSEHGVRLVKGSHIVVPQLYRGDHAFLLQNPDRRVIFAVPYEGEFTLIGTTDEPWTNAPGKVRISKTEIEYLCAAANRYFEQTITPADIVWSYSGIRPLHDDHAANASAVTRDYVLDLDQSPGEASMLSIFGGKITTYRKLAEHAMEHLAPLFPDARPPWTADSLLPGADFPAGRFDVFFTGLVHRYPDMPTALLRRLSRAYGTRALNVLGNARAVGDLGQDFGGGLYAQEVDYLVREEWARTAQDILYRRSKLGLHVPAQTAAALDIYLAAGRSVSASPPALRHP